MGQTPGKECSSKHVSIFQLPLLGKATVFRLLSIETVKFCFKRSGIAL